MPATIDINRLEKVRRLSTKITARCPACASTGGDKSGTHFFQNAETGKFGCAAFPSDAEHRREIFRLVGIKSERDPAADREWGRNRMKQEIQAANSRRLSAALKSKRNFIVANYPWTSSDALSSSPVKNADAMNDPRGFIASLFPADAVIWTGDLYHSGQDGLYASRWKSVTDWQLEPVNTVGPMVSPAIWNPGTSSRSGDAVAAAPYEILDFDGFDKIKPVSPDEIRVHLASSMAIVRWLREKLDWQLAALLFTGNKSLHAWFHTPSKEALESLRSTADAIGIDAGLIGHPEHPCRLPSWPHAKTGIKSKVIYLKSPAP